MPWSYPPCSPIYLTSQGQSISVGGQGEQSILAYANVNTAAASATVRIYAGANSTSGTRVAIIDASAATGRAFQYMIRCQGGITAVMQGGNADVTLAYI